MAGRTGGARRARRERKGARTRPQAGERSAPIQAQLAEADETEARRFPVVGLGASAGGLGALEQFFEQMPPDSGMAFVVVTHQHPEQTSLMAELLGRKTAMPVVQVGRPTALEPNHVYTVRPGHKLSVVGGVLHPVKTNVQAPHMPVDHFFRSLAQDQKDCAIAIVLSGTGTDGSLGLKEIKGELGMVMVQEEQSAQYSGMPHSAIATEVVDYVLPVASMPKQLLAYAATLLPGRARPTATAAPPFEALQQIFLLIRDRTGHDFSQYKQSTVGRRIERRMNVHHYENIRRYVRYLQSNPTEVELLFKELLIGVTSFFRDGEAWDALGGALGELLADKPDDYVVRAWVPGCSTGEEAYSLAILLRERMDALKRSLSVQIFATDLDASAIDVARAGAYPLGIANDVSATRLARFFIQEDDTYRVKKELREMIVFAPQNLVADPPFTKLDLLSCRNLLIYLDVKLQKRLLPIFHYSLKQKGLLFLGSSESIGPFVDLFATVDKKWKIFRRSEVVAGAYVAEFPATTSELAGSPTAPPAATIRGGAATHVDHVVDKMLLKELVPPTVLVHERGDVVHVHGRTGLFLEPAPGPQNTANIFNMARQGLQISLAAAIRQAAAGDREVVQRGVQFRTNGSSACVDVRVLRLREPDPLRGLFRITFDNARATSRDQPGEAAHADGPPDRISELERELQYTKESHQGTIEELETANEELKSTNEELQSTNEELQSANEELETSKEEMQSLNEELQTVNAELQGKVDELSRANNDMRNLLNATDIATVFLDNELRIKRYTEQAKRVIRLIPTDVGRPIGDLVLALRYDHLVEDAREVLRSLVFKETEVRSADQRWYLMRILPYRTTDNVIDGLVLTFVDVTAIKGLQEDQARLLDALRGSPVSVFGQDRDLRITWAFGAAFGRDPADLVGRSDRDLFPGEEADRLATFKQSVLAGRTSIAERIELTVAGRRRTFGFYVEGRRGVGDEICELACVTTDLGEVV